MVEERYRPRLIDKRLDFYLSTFGAVCVQGPKWCGKTWTSLVHSKSSYFVGDPADNFANRELAQLEVDQALLGESPHLIDEWQEVPAIWDAVRYSVDQRAQRGCFILTGSSTPQNKGVLHSGTGRIACLPMHPMSLYESGGSTGVVSLEKVCSGEEIGVVKVVPPTVEWLVTQVVRGGWPSALGLTDEQAFLIPREYVENVINTDIGKLDDVERDPVKVRRCLKSLARNESTTVSTATLKADVEEFDGTSIGINTISAYLGAFERMFLTHDTEPFSTFLRSPIRIKQQRKRRFCDPSIAAALLGATPALLMRDLRTFGFLFESLAVRDLEIYAESLGGRLYHYQDYEHDEFDAVIQMPDGSWSAFEVKFNPADIDEAAENLVRVAAKFTHNPPKALGVVVGKYGIAHRRTNDGVYVLPITALGR